MVDVPLSHIDSKITGLNRDISIKKPGSQRSSSAKSTYLKYFDEIYLWPLKEIINSEQSRSNSQNTGTVINATQDSMHKSQQTISEFISLERRRISANYGKEPHSEVGHCIQVPTHEQITKIHPLQEV